MNARITNTLAAFLACAFPLSAQQDAASGAAALLPASGFDGASQSVEQRLNDAVGELDELRAAIQAEQVPLNRELRDAESELSAVRAEYQQVTRLLDSRTLDLTNLRTEIGSRRDEAGYLSNLLSEYARNFESRLHIVELQRYAEPLEHTRLALENSNLDQDEVYAAEIGLLQLSLERLDDALGGARFPANAVDAEGLVQHGQVALVGPTALFRSDDGGVVGSAEQRLGSLEPTVIAFANPETLAVADQLVASGVGALPLDPTMGNAHKIEATQESFLEHVQKGGAVMWPILAMAAAAMLIALGKWLSLAFLRKPSQKQIDGLLDAVAKRDTEAATEKVLKLRGPVGSMLATGVANLHESRELIEELMYERVLTARLKLERFLPFIAICAASAPLLGLLGTVTGIINTFKLITVFGSGDVKSLSGGISEALITTKFGLIVAIPSLLLHAFLSRKVRGVVSQMESSAVAFVNQADKAASVASRELQVPDFDERAPAPRSAPEPVGV
ncbi:MAG: flagellar motor protein MotA [Planctomycetota bacterium]|nr:MAG: flagellar motor protein MotA [Planctomycetota bacterium]